MAKKPRSGNSDTSRRRALKKLVQTLGKMRKKTKDEQDTLFTALVEALDDYGKALSALRNNQYSISVFLKTFLRILETSDLPKREVSVIRRLIQFADEDMFSAETLAEGALQRSLQSLQEISRLLKK